MMNIAFFESITPYWVDMHNYIYKELGVKIYYLHREFQGYNISRLNQELLFTPEYFDIGNKNSLCLRKLYRLIKVNQPKSIISIEFSLLTVQLILLRMLFGFKYKIIVRTDDSIDLLKRGLTLRNRISKKICLPFIENLILCDTEAVKDYRENSHKGIYFPIIRDERKMRRQLDNVLPITAKLIEKYQLNNKRVLLYVGRITEVKNIETLLNAFRKTLCKDKVLVIVGNGNLENKIKNIVHEYNIPVIFTGRLDGDEILAWYNVGDVFVLPSWIEPFGAVVNEALISGCYSLISERAGSKSLIKENVNGNLFPPSSSDILAELIDKSFKRINKRDKISRIKPNLMPDSFENYARELRAIIH